MFHIEIKELTCNCRFEPDMLAFSGCYYGGGDKERAELGKIRKRWKTLHVSVFSVNQIIRQTHNKINIKVSILSMHPKFVSATICNFGVLIHTTNSTMAKFLKLVHNEWEFFFAERAFFAICIELFAIFPIKTWKFSILLVALNFILLPRNVTI